ncbi:MAG TPA: hypothetical protein DE060_18715 [Lentisphaeria bacterium]|nr:hypothetical protein [Lentisphaeria bacterium]HCG51222.1 hypothetical protein [Lentisphaeria bacterium]
MSFLPFAQIEQTTRTAPENLIFFSGDRLIAVVSDAMERYSEDCRLECLAELVVRWYLKPSAEIEDCLDSAFPAKEWHSLKKLKEQEIFAIPTAAGLPQKLWSSADPFLARCEVAMRKRLADLLETDGFIPVYSGKDAFFLSFRLVDNDRMPLIGDSAGVRVENWTDPYLALFGENPKYRCIVRCRQNPYLPPFSGHSLMLPLYLACQRKSGSLPAYNQLRLLSTGAIEMGHLKAVEIKEKQQALNLCFSNAYLFFPESSQIHSEERNSVPLNIAFDLDAILEEVRRQIEAKGLVIPTFQDAKRRLEQLDYETRHANQDRWEIMLARLQTNMDAIQLSQDRSPESYLLCLMLKSAMHCHMGNTVEALKFNREAKEKAKSLHLEKHLRRLEIEELVDLQDVEDFDSIRLLAGTLKAELERLEDDDLLMRYYGTLGQAHCYGFLSGIPGFERDAAQKCFTQALRHAQKLESEQDIAQDLNYNYLWYVLFDPVSAKAALAYAQAHDHIERNLQSYPQSQKKNRYFLQRFKLQALYRQLLTSGEIDPVDYHAEDLPEEAVFWLQALVKKYLAAIAAANGEKEIAEQYFMKASVLLEQGVEDNIIAFIRMTTLAEAYQSLRSENWREAALASFNHLSNKYITASTPWQNYLLNKTAYPGLNYWY